VYIPPPPPPVGYPVPGFNYPLAGGTAIPTNAFPMAGYYEPSSITNPVVGLWRRTYNGTLLDGTNIGVETFPTGFAQVESQLDTYVGFGQGIDVSTYFTMEWKGYFRPETTADYTFTSNVDDYMFLWIGQNAVSGFNNQYGNYILQNSSGSDRIPMIAGKYYPVRMRYTELQGGHSCVIAFGISGYPMLNNLENGAIGQFYTDDNTSNGTFPASGLIT